MSTRVIGPPWACLTDGRGTIKKDLAPLSSLKKTHASISNYAVHARPSPPLSPQEGQSSTDAEPPDSTK